MNSIFSDWRAVFLAAISGGSSVDRAKALANEAVIVIGETRDQVADSSLRNELDRALERIETLIHERGYACEKPCGECCGCALAHEELAP